MATPGKPLKKDAKTHVQTKTSFTSPFTPQWRPLPQEDMHFILKTLQEKLASMGLEKKEVKVFRPWRKRKAQAPSESSEPVSEASKDTQMDQDPPERGWTDVAARRQLAIGINEVTKALERSELKLVLVCKSVKPKHMTNHLIALSATRGVPACQVPRLSHSVSEPLGLKSVLALGFRKCACKDEEVFADTVDAIAPRVPSLDVPWLEGVTLKHPLEMSEVDEEEAGGKTAQKRKLDSESEVAAAASSCRLQPLKVKKIVANPAKKRKKRKLKSQPAQ